NLALIEPDAIDKPFDCAVQISVFKNDERRFPAEFKRKLLVRLGRGAANRATYFGRTGEGNLVYIGMLDERFAGRTITRDDIHDARRQTDFNADFGERK